jgi:hypothetical protein
MRHSDDEITLSLREANALRALLQTLTTEQPPKLAALGRDACAEWAAQLATHLYAARQQAEAEFIQEG